MKKFILIIVAVVLLFIVPSKVDAQVSNKDPQAGLTGARCGFNIHLAPQCGAVKSVSCTQNSDCCTNICIPTEPEITTETQCNEDEACLQALAKARSLSLEGGHLWFVHKNADGSYTVVCDNGWIETTFKAPSPTPTTVPACNSSCSIPSDCTGARDGCTSCINNKCQQPPTATPTTTIPACNTSCTTPADCTGARDGCTSCINNKCQQPPTPTTRVPACNVTCSTPADCTGARDGCTSCVNNTCQRPPTPTTPPTATPTATATPSPTPDPFREDMCKCDGLEVSKIEQGKPITVTAFGKVLATDDKYAKISTVKFTLMKGNGSTQTLLLDSGPLPAQKIASPADIVRYSTAWTFEVPQPIDKGVEYRVFANTKCSRQTAFAPRTQTVAAAQDQNLGLFDRIALFISNLFGGKSDEKATATTTTVANPKTEDQLKLGTFEPLSPTIIENNKCNILRFKYEAL